jgi:hypothetical protein
MSRCFLTVADATLFGSVSGVDAPLTFRSLISDYWGAQSTGSHDAERNSHPEEELIVWSKCKSPNVSYIIPVILRRPFCIKLLYKILEQTRILWIDVPTVCGIILTELASWRCALLEEFARYATIQDYPNILRNPKFHNRVYKNSLLVPMLSQMSPANNTPPYLSNIHFVIINPDIFWSFKVKVRVILRSTVNR